MDLDRSDLDRFHSLAKNNKGLIQFFGEGNCFHCLKTCSSSEINEWTDSENTAICPHCGIDSILPGEWSQKMIKILKDKYFSE